ncbi:glycerol-3-phosphate acyltransferase [Hankyongella ginsenosidimutans]|uniref:glycerol-3-phosphate acyltransferase n=1 Tax=Hankyongella ginsenosidimutans TaxID=1763828 RepID=UPI00319E8E0D
MLRTGNKGLAAATLLLDALKGAVPVWLALAYAPGLSALVGVAAFLGHLYPVWLKFKGGKGVATYIGVMLALSPVAFAGVALAWLLVARLFRYSSLAALVAVLVPPVVTALLGRTDAVAASVVMAALVWFKHSANIARLRAGTEPRIGAKNRTRGCGPGPASAGMTLSRPCGAAEPASICVQVPCVVESKFAPL